MVFDAVTTGHTVKFPYLQLSVCLYKDIVFTFNIAIYIFIVFTISLYRSVCISVSPLSYDKVDEEHRIRDIIEGQYSRVVSYTQVGSTQ